MAGTHDGGKQTADTVKELYGPDYYRKIGAIGGKNSRNGGFGSEKVGADGLTGKERAIIAGSTGGTISKRGPATKGPKGQKDEDKDA